MANPKIGAKMKDLANKVAGASVVMGTLTHLIEQANSLQTASVRMGSSIREASKDATIAAKGLPTGLGDALEAQVNFLNVGLKGARTATTHLWLRMRVLGEDMKGMIKATRFMDLHLGMSTQATESFNAHAESLASTMGVGADLIFDSINALKESLTTASIMNMNGNADVLAGFTRGNAELVSVFGKEGIVMMKDVMNAVMNSTGDSIRSAAMLGITGFRESLESLDTFEEQMRATQIMAKNIRLNAKSLKGLDGPLLAERLSELMGISKSQINSIEKADRQITKAIRNGTLATKLAEARKGETDERFMGTLGGIGATLKAPFTEFFSPMWERLLNAISGLALKFKGWMTGVFEDIKKWPVIGKLSRQLDIWSKDYIASAKAASKAADALGDINTAQKAGRFNKPPASVLETTSDALAIALAGILGIRQQTDPVVDAVSAQTAALISAMPEPVAVGATNSPSPGKGGG